MRPTRPKQPGSASRPPWREAAARRDDQRQGRRRRHYDVIAVSTEPSLKGSSDPDIFEGAQAQKRAVVTYNRRDFEPLAAQFMQEGRAHHGLIIVNPNHHPNDQFSRLVSALDTLIHTFTPFPSFVTWLQDGPAGPQ